jgi:pimeloyl-ACP methyl ester carboxylesterase
VAESSVVSVNGVKLHYLIEGTGAPLVLLHGWPETSHCWRKLIPLLAHEFTLVAPDLRGYGRSDKPATGYDKRTMASDILLLLRELGLQRAALVGHDRGARVAHRLALDHPEAVEALVLLDIVPTREVWERMDATLAVGFWHWLFHLQRDLPEQLVSKDVAGYLGFFFERWTTNRGALEPDAIEHYVKAFSAPGALRAGFDDYRAAFPTDAEHDDGDARDGKRVECPVLVLWGADGLVGTLPVLDIWGRYATSVRGAPIDQCGHFLPEEAPERVAGAIRVFLSGG